MRYNPGMAVYYFDETEEIYKEVPVYAVDVETKSYDHLYQWNVLSGEYVEIDNKDLFDETLAAIKKYVKKNEAKQAKQEYDPNKCIYRYDKSSKEYEVADKEKVREYDHIYQWDASNHQFVEVDKVDYLYKEALIATKNYAEKEEEKVDNVNHPKHYEGSCSIECIDAMRFALGDEGLAYFCAGNAFKYLWRYKFKNGQEDIDKARWYVDKLSELSDDNDFNRDADTYKVITKLYEKVNLLLRTVINKDKYLVFEEEENYE